MTKIVTRVTFDFAYEAHDPDMTPDRVKRILTGYFEDVVRQGWANLDGFDESAIELATPVALGVFTRYEDITLRGPYRAQDKPKPVSVYRTAEAQRTLPKGPLPKGSRPKVPAPKGKAP